MMAIANHLVHIGQRLQARRQRTKRDERRTLDPANLMLPRLAHINENELFSAIHPRLHVGGCYLQLVHLFSLPNRWGAFPKKRQPFLSRRKTSSTPSSIRVPLLRVASRIERNSR